MKALSLSIVIPAYNEQDHLETCLDAIGLQTVMPDEVIVVDNNSTDSTVAVARRYPFVRVVTAHEQGVVYARNVGFDAVTSQIIGRIDADTILPNTWVADILKFYEEPEHAQHAFTGGGYFYNVPFPRASSWILDQIAFRMNRLLMGHYIVHGSNMALPRELWQAVRTDICLRNDIHEDLDLAIHLHRRGYSITYNTGVQVGIKMRRVFDGDWHKRWDNLKLWPQTLRVHHFATWIYGYLGAALLQSLSPLLYLIDITRRLIGRGQIARDRLIRLLSDN